MPCACPVYRCDGRQYYDSEDEHSDVDEETGPRKLPVSAALRAMRADIKTYTEVKTPLARQMADASSIRTLVAG